MRWTRLQMAMASRLDEVAPGPRRRSDFILATIRRGLAEVQEHATERAYREHPGRERIDVEPPRGR